MSVFSQIWSYSSDFEFITGAVLFQSVRNDIHALILFGDQEQLCKKKKDFLLSKFEEQIFTL